MKKILASIIIIGHILFFGFAQNSFANCYIIRNEKTLPIEDRYNADLNQTFYDGNIDDIIYSGDDLDNHNGHFEKVWKTYTVKDVLSNDLSENYGNNNCDTIINSLSTGSDFHEYKFIFYVSKIRNHMNEKNILQTEGKKRILGLMALAWKEKFADYNFGDSLLRQKDFGINFGPTLDDMKTNLRTASNTSNSKNFLDINTFSKDRIKVIALLNAILSYIDNYEQSSNKNY